MLGLGSASTAALAATQSGLPALGPALGSGYDITLVQVTAVFTAFGLGTVHERLRVGRAGRPASASAWCSALGPLLAAVALVLVALSGGYGALLAGMFVAGALAASAAGGSGRAVFGWFPRAERGFALGLRQTAVPLGAAAASFSLPALAAATSVDVALLVMAGGAGGVGAGRGAVAAQPARARARRRRPHRPRRATRASGGSASPAGC